VNVGPWVYNYPQVRTRDLACTAIVVRMARRLLLGSSIVKDLSKKKFSKLFTGIKRGEW